MKNAKLLMLIAFCIVCWGSLSGCAVIDIGEFFAPTGEPNDLVISATYNDTVIGGSNAAEVLETIHLYKYALLSQSKTVIASQGKMKRGHKMWFTMVGFDENSITARRKYLFVTDERPKFLFRDPWTGFSFDSRAVIDSEILTEPYADDNVMQIAILNFIHEKFREDIKEVGLDNKELAISGMMVNQVLEAIMVKLAKSPAAAFGLRELKGVEFEHINLDKGKIRLVLDENIATVKIMLGSFVPHFEDLPPQPEDSNEPEWQYKACCCPDWHLY